MKIRFFSLQDNQKTKAFQIKKKSPELEGYIVNSGKLVFPVKELDRVGFDLRATRFRIGAPAGKRNIKTLYLVPTSEATADAFVLNKGAKRYDLLLGGILQQGGIDFRASRYRFTLAPFAFEDGLSGYEIKLIIEKENKPKAPYTGKPRGRKPKVAIPL